MNYRFFLISLFTLLSLGMSLNAQTKNKKNNKSATSKNAAVIQDVIQWISIEEMEAKMKKEPRKVIIDVYTDWCGWCKVMDKKTFSNKELAKYINKYYYAVKLNAESKDTFNFMDKKYEFVPEYKSNRLAVELLQGQMSYPTIIIMGENMSFVNPFAGYHKIDQMESILKFFVEAPSISQENWESHVKNFKSQWATNSEE